MAVSVRLRAIPTYRSISTCLSLLQVGHYTVVLKAPNRNKHYRVKVTDGVYEIGQQKFNNLDELIDHYKKHPIFKQDTEKLYLIKPFNFPSPSSSDNF